MRQWLRATRDNQHCGYCQAEILRGAPLLEITMTSIGRGLIRCPSCAGVPVPDDLPPLVDPAPIVDAVAPVVVSATRRGWTPYGGDA